MGAKVSWEQRGAKGSKASVAKRSEWDQVRVAVHRVQVEDACNLHFPWSAANPLTLMRAW